MKKFIVPIVGFLLLLIVVLNASKLAELFGIKKIPEVIPPVQPKTITPPMTPVAPITNTDAAGTTTSTPQPDAVIPVSVNSREAKKAIAERSNYIATDIVWTDMIMERINLKAWFENLNLIKKEDIIGIVGLTNLGKVRAGSVNDPVFGFGGKTMDDFVNGLIRQVYSVGGFYSELATLETGYKANDEEFVFANVGSTWNLFLDKGKTPTMGTGANPYYAAKEKVLTILAQKRNLLTSAIRQDAISSLKGEGWKFTDN